MTKRKARSVFILFTLGCMVSAQQVSSESVFDRDEEGDLEDLVMTAPVFTSGQPAYFAASSADTIETYEIELEEEKPGNIYKEIAAVVIVAAFVVYMVKEVFMSGEEEDETDDGNNKPVPQFRVMLPIGW